MSDWEADSDDGKAAPMQKAPAAPVTGYGRKRFEDEDVEDEVKDDWEEDDEDVNANAKLEASHLQPIKKKGTVKQKIKEREERERRRAELGLGSEEEDEDDDDDDDEDPLERRRREKEAQIEADVANAANLLGTSKISGPAASDDGIGAALKPGKLSTKEEWEAFAETIFRTVIKPHAGKPGYDKFFVNQMAKLTSETLRDVDCRKQSIHWKNMADEKTRLEKERKSGGVTKTKGAARPKTVGTSSAKNTIDMRSYGDEALDDGDDLDFM